MHLEELAKAQQKSHLANFNALVSYLTSYYKEYMQANQIGRSNVNQDAVATSRKKEPMKRDEI